MKVSSPLPLLSLLLVFFLSACTADEPPPPDVSDISVDLEVLRFDREIPALDTTRLGEELERLDRTYGSFTDVFFTHLVPVRRGDFSPAEGQRVLQAYLDFPLTDFVDSLVAERFPEGAGAAPIAIGEVQELIEDFEQSLRYYQHYLPGAPVPDTLVLYDTHFELAAFLYGDGELAAGLDFFLGPDFDYSQVNPEEPIFSNYLATSYTPAHFTGKLLRVLIEDRYPLPRSGRMLDYLIYEGKKLYLLEHLMPETPDAVVYEVTEEQMDWLRENETPIYAYLQREELLFSTDVNKINKYTRPAPYTPGMPQESPGGAVNYLGRQIVAAYMNQHPDVTLPELMAMEDAQAILQGARYKPR
ncbi:hypothetical protein CLV84_0081 [Neolewinella xylanilytica]|uniref:Gliding motility-associated lipoprotein GldB n=1 Tax=Neolewinella xylanilytica TaxID=1514080 RepID=A0A2S6I6N4_9BACT|nr:hypothetical protein [Neolewinella xylanilytica]PPK87147.1 hypothetical protein CLV84_0081 [Neolewinella xylanilytica]